MTSGSLLPTMCLISSRANLTLKSHNSPCRVLQPTKSTPNSMCCYRRSRSLSLFLTVSVQCLLCGNRNSVLGQASFTPEILLGTCCSVMLVCSSLTSRGSLFVVILLLLSDQYGCSALFSPALSSLITTSSPLSSLLLVRVTSCVSPVLTSLVTSPVLVSWSVLAVTLGIVSWVRLAVGLR